MHPDAAPDARRASVSRVWEVAATSDAIIELAEQLAGQGIETRRRRVHLRLLADVGTTCWKRAGLVVWLVNARDVKHVPGRPKTDKLDAVWLAKLNERGMLRPSFRPACDRSAELRDYTRLRADLTHDRSRHKQRLEKLLEDALIKLSAVATDIIGVSGRAMLEALIAGQRDPKVLAELARGRMRGQARRPGAGARPAASTTTTRNSPGCCWTRSTRSAAQIDRLTGRIEQLIGAIPAAQPRARAAAADPRRVDRHRVRAALRRVNRLDEVPGIGRKAAQVILAEVGLDMSRFPAPRTWCRGPGCAHAPSSPASGIRRRSACQLGVQDWRCLTQPGTGGRSGRRPGHPRYRTVRDK